IEKAPASITTRHFSNMLHLGDITKIDGGKITPVHIITFGSPCQNLSNIGKREGLTGSQSSLFYHAIRIIEEMRCATNGAYPIIAVWENVMGAFSSNNRLDFKAVLESFTNIEIPMPDRKSTRLNSSHVSISYAVFCLKKKKKQKKTHLKLYEAYSLKHLTRFCKLRLNVLSSIIHPLNLF